MSFTFLKENNTFFYKFSFDLTWSIVKAVFAIIFFIGILFFVNWHSVDYSFFIGYFILFGLFMDKSFESYIEWKQNGIRLIENKDNFLYINNKKIIDYHQIKKIVIDYNGVSTNQGWLVYIEFYIHQDFILKKALSSKEADEFAKVIASFFNVEVIKIR